MCKVFFTFVFSTKAGIALWKPATAAVAGVLVVKVPKVPIHPVKIDLDKKLDSKQKTIQTFNIDAQGFRNTKN